LKNSKEGLTDRRNNQVFQHIYVLLFAQTHTFEETNDMAYMQDPAKILIYIHATFGGIGLLTGLAAVLLKKGAPLHKRTGIIFSYAMITSSLLSLVIAWLPGHHNLFLFLIGVFTIYLILSGNRALTFKSHLKARAEIKDQCISGGMLLASIVMIILGIFQLIRQQQQGILYIFFGGFGLFLSLQDFKMFRTFRDNKNLRLSSHIGRMVGALIASITAFLVAGFKIGTVLVWISPTIIGTVYIIYWNRKISTPKKQTTINTIK
jgi:uncharacterized membrane protein